MEVPLVIVGAGAAGLLAAIAAGREGAPVLVLDRNPRPGVKILMSGGGRCNLTNTAETGDLARAFGRNGSFLLPALSRFGSDDLRALLAAEGVPTVEREKGRVFPESDRAGDVVAALERAARAAGATFVFGREVAAVHRPNGEETLVVSATGRPPLRAARLVLAAGGGGYPSAGTRGDGYRLAAALGHAIVPLRPALVGLETIESWPSELSGVAVRDAAVTVRVDGATRARACGDVLFTPFGLTGPAILDISRHAAAAHEEGPGQVVLTLSVRPGTAEEEWRRLIDERIKAHPRRRLGNLLEGPAPALSPASPGIRQAASPSASPPTSLVRVLCVQAGLDPQTPAAHVTGRARVALAVTLTETRLRLKRPRPLEEAMVTAGGVRLTEVDPRTMESRLVRGLFLAGEVLDLDGPTGGYNLQAAFSTGWLAGLAAARSLSR